MPTLNEEQKKLVIQHEERIRPQQLAEYIQTYDNLSLEDFPKMSDERRKAISDILNYKSQQVNEAKQRQLLQKEANDWQMVDPMSRNSLEDFLSKYPNSQHRDEIDNCLWQLTNKDNLRELDDYLALFPDGIHGQEAREIQQSYSEWNDNENSTDLRSVFDWVDSHRNSLFIQRARLHLSKLKQDEINTMRNSPNSYSSSLLKRLIDKKVFSGDELVRANVVTPNILDVIYNLDPDRDLPDINIAIQNSESECKEGFTDVFFFGVPSTGKTCVLMGLSRTSSLHINLAAGGGKYAEALQLYTDSGVTVGRTPGTFVTTLEGIIKGRRKSGGEVKHNINLVEMSGEEFLFGIANNPDRIFSFKDIGGSQAVQLLQNDNHKVFFIIIDPTNNVVHGERDKFGLDEETGRQVLVGTEYCTANQRIILQKLIDIFGNPNNSEVMKKVDSIHFIMTKSDTLGDSVEREDKALKIFNSKFRNDILEPLIDLCHEYNINTNTQFFPKLYTFSLGSFYVAGFYEYDPTDSDRLVAAIKNSTRRMRKPTLWDKFKKVVN